MYRYAKVSTRSISFRVHTLAGQCTFEHEKSSGSNLNRYSAVLLQTGSNANARSEELLLELIHSSRQKDNHTATA